MRPGKWSGPLATAVAVFLSLVTAAAAGGELVDRVIAAVNNDVITLRDLREAAAFNAVLAGKQVDRKLEAETLEGLINRRLLLQEAYRLRFVDVTDQETAAELDRLRKRGTEEAYRELLDRTGMTEARLRSMLRERLLVEKFVQKKIGMFARVTRDEVQAYFNEHPDRFAGKRFAEVQAAITDELSAQKTNQQLDQYLTDLRNRTDVRVNPLDE